LSELVDTNTHPAWCDVRYCRGIEHVSLRFPVAGTDPLTLELFQDAEDEAPRVSIMEYEGGRVITIPAAQVPALADVLRQLPVA
jgi:hypothetical protein